MDPSKCCAANVILCHIDRKLDAKLTSNIVILVKEKSVLQIAGTEHKIQIRIIFYFKHTIYEFLTAVNIMIMYSGMKPYTLVGRYQCFRENCCIHLQGIKVTINMEIANISKKLIRISTILQYVTSQMIIIFFIRIIFCYGEYLRKYKEKYVKSTWSDSL
jgi:hypothetical protein